MKLILAAFVIMLSISAVASYESKWIPIHSYKYNEADKNILDAVKNWALSNYDTNKATYDFEYSIRKLLGKTEVKVIPVYINEAGQHIYMIDGEMCLELSEELKILDSYQCAFPPPKN